MVGDTDGGRWDDESSVDGAGQRDGEHRHGLSALESRLCVVQQHRTGLVGGTHQPTDSGGRGSSQDGSDDCGQLQLMEILRIPDETTRMQAFHRSLLRPMQRLETASRETLKNDSTRGNRPTPDSPHKDRQNIQIGITSFLYKISIHFLHVR